MNEVEGLPEGIVNEAITFAYLNGLGLEFFFGFVYSFIHSPFFFLSSGSICRM